LAGPVWLPLAADEKKAARLVWTLFLRPPAAAPGFLEALPAASGLSSTVLGEPPLADSASVIRPEGVPRLDTGEALPERLLQGLPAVAKPCVMDCALWLEAGEAGLPGAPVAGSWGLHTAALAGSALMCS
jgi:hypothetical protein